MEMYYISSKPLDFETIDQILKNNVQIALSENAIQKINHCRTYLDEKIKNYSEPIYGVTTGFGAWCIQRYH